MFDQMTLLDTRSATSSPASESGAMPCDSQAGPTIGPYGPDLALASLSAKQAADLVRQTKDTCGLYGATSLSSVALQQSLVSRLRVRLQSTGSPLFKMTWKAEVMPSRRLIYRLRASGLRTSGNDCTSWPTAAARDWKSSASNKHGHNARPLNEVARLAFWSTPRANKWGFPDAHGSTEGPLIGLHAETAKPGQLNPAHSRWLIGLSAVWDDCGVTAMQSLPRSRRNSSARTCTPGDRT